MFRLYDNYNCDNLFLGSFSTYTELRNACIEQEIQTMKECCFIVEEFIDGLWIEIENFRY